MSTNENIPDLERPIFFDGQRLTAADLTAVQEYQRQMRWLHNRSLHTWGIVFGLEVTAQRGDRELTVQGGLALDCLGRELLLSDAVTLPIPPVASKNKKPAGYYLTISYVEDNQLTPTEMEEGVCETNGAVRLPEKARLRFQSLFDQDPSVRYSSGKDVILATISVENCKLTASPATKERRDARPANQPYVATGFTTANQTTWSAFEVGGSTVGLKAVVDTSAAGFGATPLYSAQVVGSRVLVDERGLMDGMINIADATPTGFTLLMIFPSGLQTGDQNLNPDEVFSDPVMLAQGLEWSVAWLGIEG